MGGVSTYTSPGISFDDPGITIEGAGAGAGTGAGIGAGAGAGTRAIGAAQAISAVASTIRAATINSLFISVSFSPCLFY